MQFPNRVRVALRKTVPFLSHSGHSVGRIQYAPTAGYVRSFGILMQFPNRVRITLQKTVLFSSLSGPPVGAYAIRPYDRVRAILRNTDAIFQLNTCGPSKNCPIFVPFGVAGWGVCDTLLQSGTCDPSKYRCDFPTEYVRPFKKQSRFRLFPGRGVGRIQYTPTTGYIRPFEILMRFPNQVRVALRKTVPFSSPSGPRGGAYAIRPYGWVRAILWDTDAIPKPSTYYPSKNCPVFVPFGAAGWAYSIRPYNWVRAILRNTDAISQPGTYYPSKNCPVSIPFGAVCGAYSIRPYDRIHVILRNTDVIPQPGTCEGSKNGSVYATDGGVWWGVFNTPLQPGTCNSSKYRCDPTIGYVRSFEIPMQYPDWLRAILRNTDTISRSERRGCLGGGAVGVTVCGGGGRG